MSQGMMFAESKRDDWFGTASWAWACVRQMSFSRAFPAIVGLTFTLDNSAPASTQRLQDSAEQADIHAAVDGDEEAYRRLIERHQQAIGNYLWKFTRDRSDWDELLQSVFVRAYVSLRQFRGDGPFVGWLRGIATHVGYRFWTERKRHRDRTTSINDAPLSQLSCQATSPLGLFEMLEYLPPRDRLVLTLLYVDEQSVAEASQLTGWSESSVKVQAHRARAKLKILWEQHHAE